MWCLVDYLRQGGYVFARVCLFVCQPLSSNRQHYKIDDCLEDNREDY